MAYPKSVYAIFPFDSEGNVAGVYVGSTWNLKERIRCHIGTHVELGKQTLLHDLMRNNGFICVNIGIIQNFKEAHIEYDWIDFFQNRTNLNLFNNRIGLCNANWHRIGGESA